MYLFHPIDILNQGFELDFHAMTLTSRTLGEDSLDIGILPRDILHEILLVIGLLLWNIMNGYSSAQC